MKNLCLISHRCSLITFMTNKPDKYGIKFWVIVDVNSKYVSDIISYLGARKVDGCVEMPLAESVVMKIADYVSRKGCNITGNNFFTFLPLAKKLANEKISVVGTMRKNRRELSKEMTEVKKGACIPVISFWKSNARSLFVKYQASNISSNINLLSKKVVFAFNLFFICFYMSVTLLKEMFHRLFSFTCA